MQLDLPDSAPVLLKSLDVSASPQHERGVSSVQRFDANLRLRNIGSKTIVGIAVGVFYPGVGHSPAASTVVTGLRAAPQADFPLHLAVETAHGTRVSINSPDDVQLSLDCVLFNDLSSYGADPLHEKLNLLVYELQARRERAYLSQLFETGRLPDIREELNFGLPPEPPAWILTLASPPNLVRGETLPVQPLVEDSPIQISSGSVEAVAGRFWSPLFQIRSKPGVSAVSVDIALIIADQRGRQAIAAVLPFATHLSPGGMVTLQSQVAAQATALDSVPVLIRKCYAFVSDVQFADGSVWIPSRADLEKASAGSLLVALASCPERQRLSEIFRRGGMRAVASDLKHPD